MRAVSEVASTYAGTPEQRRIRRLFAVLDDVAHYTAGNAGTRMLVHAWDRITDLLLASEDLSLRAAVRAVAEHEAGSSGWWHSVRVVTRIVDEHHAGLTSGGG